MSLELLRADHTNDYAKSIRSLQNIIENHPYISFWKFLSLKLSHVHLHVPHQSQDFHILIKLSKDN
jgi:hypothetical protein